MLPVGCHKPTQKPTDTAASSVDEFVYAKTPTIALTHVQIIDGTGAPAKKNQTVVVQQGRIHLVGSSADTPIPAEARVLDLPDHTVIPGLVGMNDPMFYATKGKIQYLQMDFSFPRLYLACGVTTLRTGDVMSVERDLEIKRLIDAGNQPGPKMHVTAPYITTTGSAEDIGRVNQQVGAWIAQGVTSIKTGRKIRRGELAAAIKLARERGCKVTGELCAVGFREAAGLGVDDIQHGLINDSEFYAAKKPDECPGWETTVAGIYGLNVNGAAVQDLIRDLIAHHVAITSTLPAFEMLAADPYPYDRRMVDALSAEAFESMLDQRARVKERTPQAWQVVFRKEMEFERSFAKAGGLLLLGVDPTVWGGVIAGFGDQRALELLVEAGFRPEQVINIATANGAKFLGEFNEIGSIEQGKRADLVVIRGDPAAKISDVKNVEIVFKDGVAYDSDKLLVSIRGQVGIH